MERQSDLAARCALAVVTLNDEHDWRLDAAKRQAYSAALARYAPPAATDDQLRQVALRYHHDHAQVQALAHATDARHDAAWRSWVTQVLPILRHAGLGWTDDAAIDADDLAQVARAALVHALPSFRYASRFSTWSHRVIVRSIQRYLRDLNALKRAARPHSLDQAPERFETAINAAEHPETLAHARTLAGLIDEILHAQPDQRLAVIFQLWALHDLRIEQIGQHVSLKPAQVRLLLQRARVVLQNDPRIASWREALVERDSS
jgi:RNA polymerase sigma factor (sigma-70 family)